MMRWCFSCDGWGSGQGPTRELSDGESTERVTTTSENTHQRSPHPLVAPADEEQGLGAPCSLRSSSCAGLLAARSSSTSGAACPRRISGAAAVLLLPPPWERNRAQATEKGERTGSRGAAR